MVDGADRVIPFLFRYKTALLAVGFAGAIVAGVLAYGASSREAGRLEAENAALSRTLETVTAARDSTLAALVVKDSVAQEGLIREDSLRDLADAVLAENVALRLPAEVQVATAGRDVDATLDSLLAVATPEIRPVVLTLTVQIQDERRAQEDLHEIDRRTIETQGQVIASLETTVEIQAGQITGLREAVEVLTASDAAARAVIEGMQRQEEGPWYGGIVNVATHVGSFALGLWTATQID